MMRILLRHQLHNMLLDVVNNEYLLGPWSMLNERLHYPASIMLVNQILEFISDGVDWLLYDRVFVFVRLLKLLLLHEQLIIIDSQLLDQIRHFLLLPTSLRVCLVVGALAGTPSWFSISIWVYFLLITISLLVSEGPLLACFLTLVPFLVASTLLLLFGVECEIYCSGFITFLSLLFFGWFIACFYFSLFI